MYVDDIKLAGKKQNLDPMWKVLNKEVDLEEPTSFLDHVYLGCTQRQCEVSQNIVDNYRTMFESRISAGGLEKLSFPQSSYFFMVLWHGWSCKEVCGTILWVGEQDDSTTLQSIYSTTSKKKKWNLLENCHKYALKLFWNAYIWHVLDNLIFYGQWISLHDRSQNGPKPVTNAWIDWYHTFIIHVNIDNIVMWVILLNSADWDWFKTLTCGRSGRFEIHFWRNIVRLGRSYILSSQKVGCARNKLLFLTVQQNLKLSLWTRDWDWMVCPLWNFWI